jgi:hypothetical protein
VNGTDGEWGGAPINVGEVWLSWFTNKHGGLEHFLFFHILGMSSPQLTNSYFYDFSRWFKPPTRIVIIDISTINQLLEV